MAETVYLSYSASDCYYWYYLSCDDFIGTTRRYKDWSAKKTCMPWTKGISYYPAPSDPLKFEPLHLPDASVQDAENYCRMVRGFPFYPVCITDKPENFSLQQFLKKNVHKLNTLEIGALHFCEVRKCPNEAYGKKWISEEARMSVIHIDRFRGLSLGIEISR